MFKKRYRVRVFERLRASQGQEEIVDRALKIHGGRVPTIHTFAYSPRQAGKLAALRLEQAWGLPPHSIMPESFMVQLLRHQGQIVYGVPRPRPVRRPRELKPTVQLLLPDILKPVRHCTS